jgi:hypothetical protein
MMLEADMGAVTLVKGQVADVFIASSPLPSARRALFRLFRWHQGEYTFNAEEKNLPPVLNDPMDALITAALRERQGLELLAPILPPLDMKLLVGKFQPGGLNKLTPAEMFILGLVRMHGTARAVIDSHPENDLVVCTHLASLVRRNIICVATNG